MIHLSPRQSHSDCVNDKRTLLGIISKKYMINGTFVKVDRSNDVIANTVGSRRASSSYLFTSTCI